MNQANASLLDRRRASSRKLRPGPLTPDGWQALSPDVGAVASEQLGRLLEQSGVLPASARPREMRTCRLPFYRTADLWEIEICRGRSHLGVLEMVITDEKAVMLDGRSLPIHLMNDNEAPLLDTETQARNYVHFFCNALSADGATFRVIEDWSDISWRAEGGKEFRSELERTLGVWPRSRLKALPANTPLAWEAEVTVLFGVNLFRSKLAVGRNGHVQMMEDEELAVDLPVWRTSYHEGLRRLD